MTNELKPCPFCGGTNLDTIEGLVDDPSFYGVICNDCFVSWNNGYESQDFAGWNTRPIEDELRAEIEELTAKCNQLNGWIDELLYVQSLIKQGETAWECRRASNGLNEILNRIKRERE